MQRDQSSPFAQASVEVPLSDAEPGPAKQKGKSSKADREPDQGRIKLLQSKKISRRLLASSYSSKRISYGMHGQSTSSIIGLRIAYGQTTVVLAIEDSKPSTSSRSQGSCQSAIRSWTMRQNLLEFLVILFELC
jgi:hypothetical protein